MTQEKFWNLFAKHYHVFSVFSKPNNKKYDIVTDIIINHNPQTILDLGCGSGILEIKLMSSGYPGSIVALDSSNEMLKIAKKNVKNNKCVYINGNIENLSTDTVYSCVVAINSLFLVKDKTSVLTKINKILDENGLLIIVDPKPKGSFKAFIKHNFESHNILTNLLHILRGFKNIIAIFRISIMQYRLDKMYSLGNIQYVSFENMLNLVSILGFVVIRSDNSLQADQNYLIVAKKK